MSGKLIAIQGIKGCFHEMAARKYFNGQVTTLECNSFKQLAISLSKRECDYAVMAIENTLAGSLLPNYSLISKYEFQVIGEVYLHIEMNLMVNKGTTLDQVTSVYSHPVALAQCDDFFENHPNIHLIEYHDTAAAAKFIYEQGDPTLAAVSNTLSAELYHLDIIASNIETHKRNFTRFLILANKAEENPLANKASLSLELNHEPGSLADVLLIFKLHNVNLTKIQSIPIIGKPYQYAFKIDVTWKDKTDYQNSLADIRKLGNLVDVMGEYQSQSFE